MKQFWMILLLLLLLWNFCVFLMMGIDKRKAKKGKYRIRERTLLLSALFFGALGGWLGMHTFHHKTLHKKFRYGLPALLVLNLLFLGGWAYLLMR